MIVNSAVLAQDLSTVNGFIKDGSGPVEFANVYLTLQTDSIRIVAGSVTDEQGRYSIERVSPAKYILHVKMLGYLPTQRFLTVESGNAIIEAGDILLVADAKILGDVEITARKELIQKTDQGFVLNASSNITQIGGTAADVLKNMPGVLVDADGGVTLRGKTPMTLINGRVSGLAGVDRAAQLQQIPASSIERIEIINNPSARYDADSEGGIINIILKKSEDAGTNGAMAIGAGRGDYSRLNVSALVNHKAGKWNLGASYDNWYTTRTRSAKGDRTNFDVPDSYYLTQRRSDKRLVFFQNAKFNADYSPNKKNILNFEALWAFPGQNNRETLRNTTETIANDFTGSNQRFSNEIVRSNTVEGSVKYIKKFDEPGRQLAINLSNAFAKDKENTDITSNPLSSSGEFLNPATLQRTHVYQKTDLMNFSADYTRPAGEHGLIETGYKGIGRYLQSDYERAASVNGSFVTDPANTNLFTFNEQIHAAYFQYSGRREIDGKQRWRYNAGLRAEQVWNNGTTADASTDFHNQYFNLFPSASVAYYTERENDIRLSYGRRITRPGLGQLNPFTDITDSLNQRSGNPRLKPELIHSLDLSYNHNISKGSVSLSGFYRIRNRAILPYTVLDVNGVALTKPQNFGRATTFGMEIIGSYNPFPVYSFNASVSAFKVMIDNTDNAATVSQDLISWYAKMVNNFTLNRNASLQITGNYTAPTAIPQGQTIAVYFVDIGYQHKIMNGKGRIGAVVTDVFNTQKSGQITSDSNFYFSRIFKQDTRAVMVTFGYTFRGTFRDKLMENRFKND